MITTHSSSKCGATSLEQRSTKDSKAWRQFSTTSWSFSLSPPSMDTSCSVAWFTIWRKSGATSLRCWPILKPAFLLTVLMHWMYFCFSALVEAARTSVSRLRIRLSSWRSASTEESAPTQAMTFFRSEDLCCLGFSNASSDCDMLSWSDHCMTRLSPNLLRKSWKTSVHSSLTSTDGCVVMPLSILGSTFWQARLLQDEGSSVSRPLRHVA
mmetsp:Transcript_5242/g.15478  ORF Transcript_5242/g.15478 Transcript_5242/m.15478 type:complete len:211 (+) Transcript_5242:3007-3639(+)